MKFEKSTGQSSGNAGSTVAYMCLEFRAVFNAMGLDMLNQGRRTDGGEKSSRTPGLRGQGDEEKKQRRLGVAGVVEGESGSPRSLCQQLVSFL